MYYVLGADQVQAHSLHNSKDLRGPVPGTVDIPPVDSSQLRTKDRFTHAPAEPHFRSESPLGLRVSAAFGSSTHAMSSQWMRAGRRPKSLLDCTHLCAVDYAKARASVAYRVEHHKVALQTVRVLYDRAQHKAHGIVVTSLGSSWLALCRSARRTGRTPPVASYGLPLFVRSLTSSIFQRATTC